MTSPRWPFVATLLVALAGRGRPQSSAEPEELNRALVRRYVDELYNRHDLPRINEILAPEFHLKTTRQELDLAGARNLFAEPSSVFAGWTMEISEMMVDRNTVVIRNRYSGTHEGTYMGVAATHKKCETTGTEAFRIHQGKIINVWVTTDQVPLMRCVGFLR